uniref:Reverse transcriptase domain-containing protein n=1 Tax=Neobodo designis TaxID=312471 RepID=A0A7S1W0I2_NEODS|mmetsp:Transcript_47817/g.147489  ORF Transcript_47817/g.147489 Transcript_47817/m.147489 type:complete len:1251 (+) Transcript_47817:2-3754(+)
MPIVKTVIRPGAEMTELQVRHDRARSSSSSASTSRPPPEPPPPPAQRQNGAAAAATDAASVGTSPPPGEASPPSPPPAPPAAATSSDDDDDDDGDDADNNAYRALVQRNSRVLRQRLKKMGPHRAWKAFRAPKPAPTVPQPDAEDLVEEFATKHRGPDHRHVPAVEFDAAAVPRVTREEVRAAIFRHKLGRASDPYGVRPELLRQLSPATMDHLADTMTSVLTKGVVPSRWKRSVAVPVPKGTRGWRPVCLTSYLSRTWERIVAGRLDRLVQLCNPLDPSFPQRGFLRGRGAAAAVGRLQDHVREAIDKMTNVPNQVGPQRNRGGHVIGGRVTALLVDFSDAFARISPEAVTEALVRAGAPAYLIASIRSWLTDRRIRARSAGGLSTERRLDRGAPQGSVLGPILWNFCVEELLQQLRAARPHITRPFGLVRRQGMPQEVIDNFKVGLYDGVCYADDLTICTGAPTAPLALQRANEAMAIVRRWADRVGIRVSLKTQAINLSRGTSYLDDPTEYTRRDGLPAPGQPWVYNLQEHTLLSTRAPVYRDIVQTVMEVPINDTMTVPLETSMNSSTRLLGVQLAADMSADKQVDKAVARASDEVDTLCTMKSFLDPEDIRALYCAHGLSTFTYGAPCMLQRPTDEELIGSSALVLRSHVSDTDWQRMEAVHRRACRAITHTVSTADSAAVVRLAGFRSLEATLWRAALRTWTKEAAVDGAPQVWSELGALPLTTSDPADHVFIHTDIASGVSRNSPKSVRRADNLRRYYEAEARRNFDAVAYTDGSAVIGTASGSAAVFRRPCNASLRVALGFATEHQDAVELLRGGSARACSYATETVAAQEALDYLALRLTAVADAIVDIRRELPDNRDTVHIAIATDARGLLQALQKGPSAQTGGAEARVWRALLRLRPLFEISLIFFFGHCEGPDDEPVGSQSAPADETSPNADVAQGDSTIAQAPAVDHDSTSSGSESVVSAGVGEDAAARADAAELSQPARRSPSAQQREAAGPRTPGAAGHYDSDVEDSEDEDWPGRAAVNAPPDGNSSTSSSSSSEAVAGGDPSPLPAFGDIATNEVADAAANRARLLCPESGDCWWVDAARHHYRSINVREDARASAEALRFFGRASAPQKIPQSISAKSFRVLCRLRSGATPVWALDQAPGACPLCGTAAGTGRAGVGIRHLFKCPRLATLRTELRIPSNAVAALWPKPRSDYSIYDVIEYAETATAWARQGARAAPLATAASAQASATAIANT